MIDLTEASIHIDAPPQRVFDLFTTEEGLRSWMAREAWVDLRPGGAYRWVHDDGTAVSGEYVEVQPHDRLVFTYGWESGRFSDVTPGSTLVEVRFDAAAGGTQVHVAHKALPDHVRAEHSHGWTHFLGRLAHAAAPPREPTREDG